MEVYFFLITLTILVAFGLVGVGICIGRTMEHNERISDKQSCHNNSNRLLHNRDFDLRNSYMGDNDWK